MDLLRVGYFADKLTDEMMKLDGFARPGPSPEQDAIVLGASMNTVKHFLTEKQYQKKRIDPDVDRLGAVGHREIQRAAEDMKNRAGSIVVTYYGEDHDTLRDGERALVYLASVTRNRAGLPDLVVVEKGLTRRRVREGRAVTYDTGDILPPLLDEANLTRSNDAPLEYKIQYQSIWAFGLSREQRSMVVAAYLAVCLANGDQTKIEKIEVLFGQAHANMFPEYFEYFVTTTATNLWARRRHYIIADTLGRLG